MMDDAFAYAVIASVAESVDDDEARRKKVSASVCVRWMTAEIVSVF